MKILYDNKIIFFMITRYLILALGLAKVLLLAIILGPFYFGIWGFLTLILQYLSYTNLGLQSSLMIQLSTGEELSTKNERKTITSAFAVTTFTSIILLTIAFLPSIFNLQIFSKYSFNNFIFFIAIIAILENYNTLFINFYRVYAKLHRIAIYQLALQASSIPLFFIFKEKKLIYALLFTNIIVRIFGFLMFYSYLPKKIFRTSIDLNETYALIKRGLSMLVYKFSFYFIMISSSTIISYYYIVSDMGQYSFANNIALGIITLLNTIAWILYPKIMNKLKSDIPLEKANKLMLELQFYYSTCIYLVIFSGISAFPLFLRLFPKYSGILPTLTYLALTQGFFALCFGQIALLIARHQELKLTVCSMITTFVNISIALIFINIFKLNYNFVAFGTLISSIFYAYLVIRYGFKMAGQHTTTLDIFKLIFPVNISIPMIFFIIGSFCAYASYLHVAGLSLFVILNFHGIIKLMSKVKHIIKNPNMLAIK